MVAYVALALPFLPPLIVLALPELLLPLPPPIVANAPEDVLPCPPSKLDA
jgi:hypothetical protein